MLKQKYFLADIFILSAEKQPIKLSWRKIVCLLNDIHDFQDIAKQSSSGYEIIGNPTVRWIRIEDTYGIETTYIRKGENNLHTCVSSYYFFNNDKMINVILSYRKEDSETWAEDFSNIIKTFKWNNK